MLQIEHRQEKAMLMCAAVQACVWLSKRCECSSSNCCRTFGSNGRKTNRSYAKSTSCYWNPKDLRAFSSCWEKIAIPIQL